MEETGDGTRRGATIGGVLRRAGSGWYEDGTTAGEGEGVLVEASSKPGSLVSESELLESVVSRV